MKIRSLISISALSSALLFFLVASASAFATCNDNPPKITSVSKGTDGKTVVISYKLLENGGCAWPPDFFQLRWTEGEGPATQNQSSQLKGNSVQGSFTMVFDQSRLWGFILEACKSNWGDSADCTPWSPMRYYKPYGPYECHTPYVWRNAFPNDFVCVTNQTVQETVADNAAAASRLSPDHVNCIYGFVWRGAIASDHVCVTPSTRQQVADDNAQEAARQLP